jgi:UDP-N-acetylglucosamine 2-epimerase
MGEFSDRVFNVGCPSGDLALSLDIALPDKIFSDGIGARIDVGRPYVLVVFHPVTTQFDTDGSETNELLEACEALERPVVWLWPNIDAGAEKVSGAIRRFREQRNPQWLRLIKNFPPNDYLRVLANASCAIGNSSSFVRDSSFLGTPVVLIGDRQQGRESAENVVSADGVKDQILEMARRQMNRGRYKPSTLYGDGKASSRIAEHLATVKLFTQKRLGYLVNT